VPSQTFWPLPVAHHILFHFPHSILLYFCHSFLGPVNTEAMQGTVRQALPVLVAALADDNVLVKDTAAWSLSR